MEYRSDLEIAQSCTMQPICDIARTVGIDDADIEPYGRYKAKVALSVLGQPPRGKGKLILVTAITPTPAGEGKTTTTIGLADALRRIGKDAAVALREPSLGPVFGRKGGATGGGYAQVVPMEDIDLHFTGDFHAIGAANNLLAAMLDNHIQQGNALGIDPRRITWRRCVDMNDRQLRCIVDGLGGRANGVPREDGFDITVASEIMAVLCLAESMADLKARLGRIIVGYTYDGRPVTARDLKAVGAMAALLRDALKPNLVQTLEGTPAFVHGGPFANIAHGCNSVLATRMAMHRCDYAVTEAGFGADLGAEKFLDIKCRLAGLRPDAAVVVATVRALKMHGGLALNKLGTEDLDALRRGVPNLLHHVRCIRDTFGLPCVVAINRFPTDTDREIALLTELCGELGVRVVLSTVWADGGRGGDIIFVVDDHLSTLMDFRYKRKYVAPEGGKGGASLCHGKNAENLVIKVPLGTVIKDAPPAATLTLSSTGHSFMSSDDTEEGNVADLRDGIPFIEILSRPPANTISSTFGIFSRSSLLLP